jgi:hypothetical protein
MTSPKEGRLEMLIDRIVQQANTLELHTFNDKSAVHNGNVLEDLRVLEMRCAALRAYITDTK